MGSRCRQSAWTGRGPPRWAACWGSPSRPGKTIDRLEQLGYAERAADARDARRKLVRLTPLGIDALARSAAIFDDLRAQWASRLGPDRLRALEADLRTMAPHGGFRLDVPGWLGA